ncbi:hypothetical protein B7R25_15270 [Subtercola boreus]|uniref:Uncharacterized protein n=1 Tax=Subtercola boreus TaxID=120213 RepID=A0A3E0W6Y3_9MICO|nr:hypothetical protein B7R24_15240 [Subtercola boreus]RFA18391.1 hypothetical protein B7R23_15275 [Subtercola boreus]RFA24920.1 hypothetical protein B7R25_15270 [Subtercola boreus]
MSLPSIRSRVAAYLYGNILVLAAVVAVSDDAILHGEAVVVVAATTVTTFLAHVVSHGIGQQIGRSDAEVKLHLSTELRDALPILSSGVLPVIVLVLGALGVLPPFLAQLVAGGILVVRIALTGIEVERLSDNRSPAGVLWAGFALAAVSIVIVTLKVVFTH